jgi:hypothetical protein
MTAVRLPNSAYRSPFFLEGDRFAQSAERRAVFRIYIVFEKFVRPFPNVGIMSMTV